MARLTYTAITSLDGYVADERGGFDWAVPDEEVHTFVNELERPIGTYLYGRRLYETMVAWEAPASLDEQPAFVQDYARIWQGAEKVVYSTTMTTTSSARTRIERVFDPQVVQGMKAIADRDLSVGGPGLAAHVIMAGLVDDYHLVVVPTAVGGGTPALPSGVRLDLELVDLHRFDSGTIHLHYRPSGQ
jgi:dihydrofolate reductase